MCIHFHTLHLRTAVRAATCHSVSLQFIKSKSTFLRTSAYHASQTKISKQSKTVHTQKGSALSAEEEPASTLPQMNSLSLDLACTSPCAPLAPVASPELAVGFDPVALGAAAKARGFNKAVCKRPQGVVAPGLPDESNPERQNWLWVACSL